MIRNNNKRAINKLAKESFKSNKSRNKFAIISIVLTTLLFTTLFTVGISILKSSEYSTMRMVGTTFHGSFKNLTNEEYKKIKGNKEIKESGIVTMISMAENKEFAKRGVEIKYADKNYIEKSFSTPIKGDIPKNKNEILIDTITLDMLNLPYEINKKVNITYKVGKKEYKNNFVVSGIYEGNITTYSSVIYTSKDFVKDTLKNVDQEKEKKEGTNTGLIGLNVNFSNSLFIENNLLKITQESGYSEDDIDFGINWAYMGGSDSVDLGVVIEVIGFISIIMLTGYLIIYNIFYISIVKDTKFYGLLKTIGTTKVQIKNIIIKEALILSSVGIPIGLALGYIIGIVLMPIIMSTFVIEYTKISINPIIFIGATLFSLITVFISVYKPVKVASKVSLIEAVRYSGVSEVSKNKFKKTSNGAKINKMALSNIFNNKKKSVIAIASLSLSIVLLNMVYTIVSGFDIDKYLMGSIGTDFTIGDASFYRWRFDNDNLNSVTEELCNEIENIKGVSSVDKIYHRQLMIPLTESMKSNLSKVKDNGDEKLKESIERTKESNTIIGRYYGIDDGIYKLLENYVVEGKFDIEKFKSGNYIISEKGFGESDIVTLKIGEKVSIPLENGKNKEYEVMAIVDNVPLYLNIGYSFGGLGVFTGYLPSNEFKKTTSNDSIMTAMFNVDNDNTTKKVEYYINSLMDNNPTLDYRSKITYLKEFEDMINTYKIVGFGLNFIVGVIGILNFSNVIITSIIARKKEISILKSIGMTQKQVKKMITLEGLYYALITMGIVIIIGLPITYFGINSVSKGIQMLSYNFTIVPLMLSLPILFAISLIVPNVCFKGIEHESIIDALRGVE